MRLLFFAWVGLLAFAGGLAAASRPDFDDPLLLLQDTQAHWSQPRYISRLEPQRVTADATFVVRGTGFGAEPGVVEVGGETTEVLDWNDFGVRARAPDHAVIGAVTVTVGGDELESPVKLTVYAAGPVLVLPAIESVDTPDGSDDVLPGDAVVVHGHGFGATPGYAFFTDAVTMREHPFANPAARGEITSWSDTTVEATVASDCWGRIPVVLVFGLYSVVSPHRLRCPE
ncbi:MAG: hypothetical protein HY905_00560 [Deltaproteobacteria bacterium]|nr:hypothetical protein [Deltaproteobacteria bacterium]